MMNYAFVPQIGLLKVTFTLPLPHYQALYDDHFPGRDLVLNEAGEWEQLWCTFEEWEGYLRSGAAGARLIPDERIAQWMELELHIFRQWCAALRQTAFYKPAGGMQA